MKRVVMVAAAVAALGAAAYVVPERAIWQEGKGGCVLDVTRPPFNAKGDGVHDDTAAICAAIRFARDGFRIETSPSGQTHWQQVKTKNWIVYLPKGVYRVTDTLDQGWPARALNLEYGWNHIRYLEVQSPLEEDVMAAEDRMRAAGENPRESVYAESNWQIMIVGESCDKTIIRLDDGAKGYEKGKRRPVISFALLKAGSNVSLGNFLEDLSIDTGRNNPGAVGCLWACSNYGGLRRVRISSKDGLGLAGALMDRRNACGYWRDVEIEGFNIGIWHCAPAESPVTFEDVLVKNCETGMVVGGDSSDRTIAVPWRQDDPSIANLMRVNFNGVKTALGRRNREWVSNVGCMENGKAIPDSASASKIPNQIFPRIAYAKSEAEWVTPEDFGAIGDGVHDDTAAIRKAFAAGRRAVVFTRSLYRVDGTVEVPATIAEVNFLHAGIVRCAHTDGAVFRVAAASESPIVFRNGYFAGGVMIDHAAARPVVIEDIHGEFHHVREGACTDNVRMPVGADGKAPYWYIYRNATPELRKRVYASDCITLCAGGLDHAGTMENVELTARHVNNENFPSFHYSFRDSKVAIFGAKAEGVHHLVHAERSDVAICGIYALTGAEGNQTDPYVNLVDSTIALNGLAICGFNLPKTLLRSTRGGKVETIENTCAGGVFELIFR